MRVLLTGASGFLGRRIMALLRADGHTVTALLLPEEPEASLLADGFVRGDITRPESLLGAMEDQDAVVHLAGAVGYGQSFARCRSLNRDGTANVVRETVRAGVRRFVHMSSVSVYGRVAEVELTEDAPLRRIGDPYGDTKADAEEIVTARADVGDLDLTILRPTVIWGPGDVLFLPKLIENLSSGRARVVGPGTNIVDAVHVDDVARLVTTTLANHASIGGVYNVNNPGNPTWSELVAGLATAVGAPPPGRRLPYPLAFLVASMMEAYSALTGRSPRLTRYSVRVIGRRYRYVIDRARKELDFSPRIPLTPSAAKETISAG
ncbi:MAG: NAD-dependent epimerase/dehydratase family protein [bacterium]|nr:NAD-dependent epimerase/dehydratase family protein [bacterium]